jgi:hypothetical protein
MLFAQFRAGVATTILRYWHLKVLARFGPWRSVDANFFGCGGFAWGIGEGLPSLSMATHRHHFAEQELAYGERRRSVRVAPEQLTYVSFGGSNGGMVLDVSEEGLAVATAFAIPEASLVDLSIPAEATHGRIEATGRVAWIAESKRRVGVQLLDVSPGTQACLRGWISAVQGLPVAPPAAEPGTESVVVTPTMTTPEVAAPLVAEAAAAPVAVMAGAAMVEPAGNATRTYKLPPTRADENRVASGIEKTSKFPMAAALALVVLVCFALGIVIGRGLLGRWNHGQVTTVAASSRVDVPLQASKTTAAPSTNAANTDVASTSVTSTGADAAPHDSATETLLDAESADGALPGGELLITPNEGDAALRIDLGEEVIAHSPSLEIRSRRYAFVPGVAARAHRKPRKERLEIGILNSRVTPEPPSALAPAAAGQNGEQSVAVRATIDGDGHVLNVEPLSGSNTLMASVIAAIREWRYDPSSLNGKPIETDVDLTITFRPLR